MEKWISSHHRHTGQSVPRSVCPPGRSVCPPGQSVCPPGLSVCLSLCPLTLLSVRSPWWRRSMVMTRRLPWSPTAPPSPTKRTGQTRPPARPRTTWRRYSPFCVIKLLLCSTFPTYHVCSIIAFYHSVTSEHKVKHFCQFGTEHVGQCLKISGLQYLHTFQPSCKSHMVRILNLWQICRSKG